MEDERPSHHGPRFTRRGLISTGGAATAAALVARPPAALAAAADALAATPSPLRRASYAGLAGSSFRIGTGAAATGAKLQGISDLTGAPGSDDAFSLLFAGPSSSAVEQGIHRFSHSSLGEFELFVTPIESHGKEQRYEAIVNRPPRRSVPTPPTPARAAEPTAAAAAGAAQGAGARAAAIARATARRSPKGVTCSVRLTGDADVESLTAWLVRGKRIVGAATTSRIAKGRAKLLVRTERPLRRAGYEVVVIATEADGQVASKRARVTR